jgi:hypothetical protein
VGDGDPGSYRFAHENPEIATRCAQEIPSASTGTAYPIPDQPLVDRLKRSLDTGSHRCSTGCRSRPSGSRTKGACYDVLSESIHSRTGPRFFVPAIQHFPSFKPLPTREGLFFRTSWMMAARKSATLISRQTGFRAANDLLTIHRRPTDIALRVMTGLFGAKNFHDVEPGDAACCGPYAESSYEAGGRNRKEVGRRI